MENKISKYESYFSTATDRYYQAGIPIRLKLAESVMIGLLSDDANYLNERLVKRSFEIADAMIQKYNEDLENKEE